MHTFPLPVLFVDLTTSESQNAWDRLQAGVGDGLLTAILRTPETRGDVPFVMDIQSHADAEVADQMNARNALDLLAFAWRYLFETLMNQRWDLVENPYARITVVKGAVLLHQDPLGWMVDQHADDIADGNDLEDPTCVLITPLPSSAHAVLAIAAQPILLPHADLLNAELDKAAIADGHAGITPLVWGVLPVLPGEGEVVAL